MNRSTRRLVADSLRVSARALLAGLSRDLFHFSETDFKKFDLAKSSQSAIWGPGIYLSDEPETGWGKTKAAGGYLYTVRLRVPDERILDITKPLSSAAYAKIEGALGKKLPDSLKEDGLFPFTTLERRFGNPVKGLKKAGFDVLVHPPPGSRQGKHYLVVNPKVIQIQRKEPVVVGSLREDEHPDTEYSAFVKQVLARFSQQHDYPTGDRTGIERLCYELAKCAVSIGIEPIDGGWLYILPDPTGEGRTVVVACHTIDHNDRWTLSTTIYSAPDLAVNQMLGNQDHWTRAFFWEMETNRLLGDEEAVRRAQLRFLASQQVRQRADKLLPSVSKAFENLYQRRPKLNGLSIGLSEAPVLPGKIGRHEGPKDGLPYSVISIHPKAADDPAYLEFVLKHELIHYVLAEECGKYSHGPKFQDMAAELRLPRKYRD